MKNEIETIIIIIIIYFEEDTIIKMYRDKIKIKKCDKCIKTKIIGQPLTDWKTVRHESYGFH